MEEETKEGENKSEHGNSSSSSEEEFDHMAELLDHEMHYDENSDLDGLDWNLRYILTTDRENVLVQFFFYRVNLVIFVFMRSSSRSWRAFEQ